MSHHHLTIEERTCIGLMKEKGETNSRIARIIGVHRSTISRELKRNTQNSGKYNPASAARKAKRRRKNCCPRHKLSVDTDLLNTICERLSAYWSPEQIVMTLDLKLGVSTIYRAINRKIIPRGYTQYLRHKRFHRGWKKGRKRGKNESLPGIALRPPEVDLRSLAGDWELDTVAMKRSLDWCLVTIVERVTRFFIAVAVPNKEEPTVTAAIVNALSSLPLSLRRTLTSDRGSEFFGWKTVEQLLPGTKVFFADPHKPQQRGTNENTNGLLRQFYPKRTLISCPSPSELQNSLFLLNTRPRKCLNWLSPFQIFFPLLLHLT